MSKQGRQPKNKPLTIPEYTFIIYAQMPTQTFSGILGTIHMAHISLLLAGGKFLVRETYNGADPVEWYTRVLEEQSIFIQSTKQQTYKGHNYIWLEVDTEKTAIYEFSTWDEVSADDKDSFAWRHVVYPYSPTTGKECLGLACVAQDICLTESNKPPLTMRDVLEAVLGQIGVS
jgi:hypothetical protein